MRNLLRSGFFRYVHSAVFRICSVLMIAFAVLFSYRIYSGAELNEFCLMFGWITFSVLITFTIGNETTRCIRNKISTGHTKTQVYFSELILANIIVLMYFVVFLIFAIAINSRLLSHIPLKLLLQTALGFLSISLLFANVLVPLACIITSKNGSVIVCLVLIITLALTSVGVTETLKNKEIIRMGETTNGSVLSYTNDTNSDYADKLFESVLTFYRDTNPFCLNSSYNKILLPFLLNDEALEKAKEATADTIGNDFLIREVSETEQVFLNKAPFIVLSPIPFFVILGWVVFRKKSFQ